MGNLFTCQNQMARAFQSILIVSCVWASEIMYSMLIIFYSIIDFQFLHIHCEILHIVFEGLVSTPYKINKNSVRWIFPSILSEIFFNKIQHSNFIYDQFSCDIRLALLWKHSLEHSFVKLTSFFYSKNIFRLHLRCTYYWGIGHKKDERCLSADKIENKNLAKLKLEYLYCVNVGKYWQIIQLMFIFECQQFYQ